MTVCILSFVLFYPHILHLPHLSVLHGCHGWVKKVQEVGVNLSITYIYVKEKNIPPIPLI